MFQFPRFPPLWPMYSASGTWAFPQAGFPIRKSSDLTPADNSPRLFAANHVLLRLLTPRHPPCALSSLVHADALHTIRRLSTLAPSCSRFYCARPSGPVVSTCSTHVSGTLTAEDRCLGKADESWYRRHRGRDESRVIALGSRPSDESGPTASPRQARLPRKEVIQPHLPVRLPCYDFVPVISPTLGSSPLAVSSPTSGVTNSHDVTGGVYKARERIHRSMADLRLLATPASCRRVAACNLN